MHRYEMCQGKSMFSPVLNLQFIYEVAVLLLFDFRCLPFLLRTRCSIICISCIMYNYWAYLKVLQYAEEILRLAKVSLLCQGCGICANFGNKPDALPGVFLHSWVQENEPASHPERAFGTAATDLPIMHFGIRRLLVPPTERDQPRTAKTSSRQNRSQRCTSGLLPPVRSERGTDQPPPTVPLSIPDRLFQPPPPPPPAREIHPLPDSQTAEGHIPSRSPDTPTPGCNGIEIEREPETSAQRPAPSDQRPVTSDQ